MEAAVSLMNGNGSVLALFLLSPPHQACTQWRKEHQAVEKSRKNTKHCSVQTRRALQLGARSVLWSILDMGALELIRARTTAAGDQVELPKN